MVKKPDVKQVLKTISKKKMEELIKYPEKFKENVFVIKDSFDL